jgi:hypothetical protein
MARMPARDRHHVGAAAIDRKMHRGFKRRAAVAGHLLAIGIELDQLGFADKTKRLPGRDQDALGTRNARADMTETFDDAEMREHAAGGEHLGAQLMRGRK